MRRFIPLLVLMLVLLPTSASAEWYVTNDGYIASTSKELLKKSTSIAVSGDSAALINFVASNPLVIMLKGGLEVWLEDTTWTGLVKIRPRERAIYIPVDGKRGYFEFIKWA